MEKNGYDRIVKLAPGGTAERDVALEQIQIPDMWHLAQALPEPDRSKILEVWHLAHDLKRNLAGDVPGDGAEQEDRPVYDYPADEWTPRQLNIHLNDCRNRLAQAEKELENAEIERKMWADSVQYLGHRIQEIEQAMAGRGLGETDVD